MVWLLFRGRIMYITVEENIRIEFDRFFEAVKFNGFVIEDNLAELLEKLEEDIIQEYDGQSDEIFKEGYDEGHDHGYDEGRDHGFESGYEEGFGQGEDEGYDKGYDEGLESGNHDGYKIGYAEALENCNCKEED